MPVFGKGQPIRSQSAVHRAAQVHARQGTRSRIYTPRAPPYYRQLLETAQSYRKATEDSVTVIVAQTACELVAESAFEVFARAHKLTQTDKENLLPRTSDLNNKRVRALYVLMSGDRIERQPFWTKFAEHAALRHKIVHKGERATARQADASLRAAGALIAHVESVLSAPILAAGAGPVVTSGT